MITIVCIKRKSCKCNHFVVSGIYTIISFGCSAFEGVREEDGKDVALEQDFKLRPISKTVYSIVLIGFSVVFGVTTAPGLLENNIVQTNSTLGNSNFVSQDCTNLCPRESVNQTELRTYCDDIQEHIDINIHIGMWIAIGVLFILSWLELALEACGKFMPYHQIFKRPKQ